MRLTVSVLALSAAALSLTSASAGDKKGDDLTVCRDLIFQGINELRATEKAAALKRNARLDAAAQKHVENMAKKEKYGDIGNGHLMDDKRAGDRMTDEGYAFAAWSENCAWSMGVNDAKKNAGTTVAAWFKSDGHRKNLLNPLFTETGIGVARDAAGKWYYCQVFGLPKKAK